MAEIRVYAEKQLDVQKWALTPSFDIFHFYHVGFCFIKKIKRVFLTLLFFLLKYL